MIERFREAAGRARLVEALCQQTLVASDEQLANAIAETSTLEEILSGTTLITQGDDTDDVYLILVGSFEIIVNGRTIARRDSGVHVGEMAALLPTQARSSTVKCTESAVVARLPRDAFIAIGERFPQVWRRVAKELSRRLMQRNDLLTARRDQPRVFVMSSSEALPIARAIQTALAHDPYTLVVWTDGVFQASTYPLESLEHELDQCDFAIAIAAGDDTAAIRDVVSSIPRDNVTFELGFFMGRLGRQRTLLLEPRGEHVKLSSDLAGLTTIGYSWERGDKDNAARIAPACNRLRDIFADLGSRA